MNVTRAVPEFSHVREIPPLRPSPFEPDEFDARRAELVLHRWHSQDDLLRARDRQVEENIRMLLGQQWIVWDKLRNRFVDVSRYLTNDERRWRQLPVLNRLMLWYMLLHARFTENPPVITFNPGPDRVDAELAEIMDPLFKYLWRDTSMLEVLDRMFSWMIPSGRAFLKSYIDPYAGDPIEFTGPAILRLLDADGNPVMGSDGQPIQRLADGVPYDHHGQPLARLVEGEDGTIAWEPTGEAHRLMEGAIRVAVLTCLDARGEWGPTPWHEKRWHIHRSFVTPEQAWEIFGVELEPDVRGSTMDEADSIWRLYFSSGIFGAADHRESSFTSPEHHQEYVTLYEMWERPGRLPGTERTRTSPGGRLTIVTGSRKVLRDGVRYAPFKYTSPIRCFDFVTLPGRPQGTSPQEMLNGPQRTRNRMVGQLLNHATLLANPITMVDTSSGLKEGDVKNQPGGMVYLNMSGLSGDPIRYAKAPDLGRDVHESIRLLGQEIDQLGQIEGARGAPPTADASGELVRELRANSDRFVGPPLRRAVIEIGRLAEDWRVMIPIVWDHEKVIQIAGEDGIARTITVLPHLFEEGTINVEPEIESMLPEGRGERQNRMYRFWREGVWGPPDSVEARNIFLDLARFPHMGPATRPGGVDRSTAEQNVGKLLQGVPALEIPVFEWYDHAIHLFVLERFMKSPEYLKQPPDIQQQFVIFREILLGAQAEAQLNRARRQLGMQAMAARQAMGVQAGLRAEAEARGIVPEPPERGAGDQALPRTRGAAA